MNRRLKRRIPLYVGKTVSFQWPGQGLPNEPPTTGTVMSQQLVIQVKTERGDIVWVDAKTAKVLS